MPDLVDIDHLWSQDIGSAVNGDLGSVSLVTRTQQRILRRLLTVPGGGAYVWQPEYGAGLPQMIGENVDVAAIRSLIVSQIGLEPSVAKSPAPTITVNSIPSGVSVDITFTQADTNETSTLTFNYVPPGS